MVEPSRARIPADIEAPDKVVYGLTFRQLAILAVAVTGAYLAWQPLHRWLPVPVAVAILTPLLGLAAGLAVGRRDGLPLDVWLLAAVRGARAPRSLVPVDGAAVPAAPAWAPAAEPAAAQMLAPLRLPARAVADSGRVDLDDGEVGLVAVSTVNFALQTAAEKSALVEAFGRWANSLSQPTQILVSAQRVDLAVLAETIEAGAPALPHPALEDAARDHARYLHDLAGRRDPLQRAVTVVCRAPGAGAGNGGGALRHAEQTANTLSALGVAARVLDGPSAVATLTAAVDPYSPPPPGPRAMPGTPVTARESL